MTIFWLTSDKHISFNSSSFLLLPFATGPNCHPWQSCIGHFFAHRQFLRYCSWGGRTEGTPTIPPSRTRSYNSVQLSTLNSDGSAATGDTTNCRHICKSAVICHNCNPVVAMTRSKKNKKMVPAVKEPKADPPPPSMPPISSVPMSMRTRQVTTAFADDPVRSSPVHISQRDIEALNGRNFLSTNLMDYIIQKVVGKDIIPDDYLIGSSNAMSYFSAMNQYDVESTNPGDARTALTLQRKYHMYSVKQYKFLALNCSSNHFFVVSIQFDINTTSIFHQVVVFDSLRHSARGKDAVLSTSIAGKMLMSVQLFLAKFCFFRQTQQSHDLIQDPVKNLDPTWSFLCKLPTAAQWLWLRSFRSAVSSYRWSISCRHVLWTERYRSFPGWPLSRA